VNELMVVSNPSRSRRRSGKRRRARAQSNPVRRRRRSRRAGVRRNPGMPSVGGLSLQTVGLGVAGALGAELGAAAVARMLPVQFQTPIGKIGVKAGLVVLAATLGKRFLGAGAAKAIALGGGIAVGVEAFRTWVMPAVPGLSDLMEDYVADPSQLSDYIAPSLSGLGVVARGSQNSIFSPLA